MSIEFARDIVPRERIQGNGSVDVIVGEMFSGKTDELIRRLRRAKIARHRIQVFKPEIDKRYSSEDKIHSHAGGEFEAIPVKDVAGISELLDPETTVVGIDEAQFFGEEIVPFVNRLADENVRVIVAGLDTDFRGVPFGPMPSLMAIAENVDKKHAICMICGEEASRTQRIVNGKPARYDEPVVVVGAAELYEARCTEHHEVPGRPERI